MNTPRHLGPRWAALAAGAVTASTAAMAQGQDPGPPQPLWEVGVFGAAVSQQAYPGSDQQVRRTIGVPYLIYRGGVLRADRETAGLRALKTERFEVDLGVAGAFAARSSEVQARRGLPDLGTLVEFGPRLKWNLARSDTGGRWRLDLPLRGVFDLDDGAAHRGMTFEPELSFQRRSPQGWTYSASASAILADRRLAHTFYGIDPAYAQADRPAYAAQAGLVAWRLSTTWSRALSPDWRVFGFARLQSVSGAANEVSPLVRRTHGGSLGVGVSFTVTRSRQLAVD
jgi:outer membrane protein